MKPRFISSWMGSFAFVPSPFLPPGCSNAIFLTPDEFEAFRLVYFNGLDQETAAEQMGISRGTLWRTLNSARKKIATALVQRRPLVVTGQVP